MDELTDIAQAIVAPGKGILAADESTPTIKKRFDSIGVKSTESTRRDYRGLLLTTDGIEASISGVILFDETMRQSAPDGTPFPELLHKRGILPGIKVDRGAKALAGFPREKVTEGLDKLRERLAEYRELGARFAKWRAVITIGDKRPTDHAIAANAHALARYAALCTEARLVPIVEPEVLMDGNHGIHRCSEITERALHQVFAELYRHGVSPEEMVLKPNMVLPGADYPTKASPDEVADATIACFKRCVPAALPGVVFLSGGQGDIEATANLNAMNRAGGCPWELSFSFGRALQAAPLKAWDGKKKNTAAAQDAFRHRAKCNGAAREGKWTDKMA